MDASVPGRIGIVMACCAAVGAIALAGCGGGSSSTTSVDASGAAGAAPLSEDEFVSQANAICRKANQRIDALPEPHNLNGIETFGLRGNVILSGMEEKLGRLKPPDDLKKDYLDLQAAILHESRALSKMNKAARVGDRPEFEQQLRVMRSTGHTQQTPAAKAVGLYECVY